MRSWSSPISVAKVRLITHGGRNTAEKRRHFGARLREAEDVVDEQQHVLIFFVAEVLGDGERGQRHAGAGSRRLVHLAVDQRGLVDNAGLFHFHPEVVAFTGTLTDAGEHRETAVLGGDVVDELHDQNRLADAGAAEQADLAAAGVRSEKVDDLDAGVERLNRHGLVFERRSRAMNRISFLVADRARFVDGLADDVQDAAQASRGRPASESGRRCPCAGWPRTRPSVLSIATQRTVFSPRCCATSRTRFHSLSLIAGLVTLHRV